MKEYLERLLDEKGVSRHFTFSLDTQDYWGHHIVPIEVLIEFITNLDAPTQDKIKDTLTSIDIADGDIMDYLEFITRKMIEFQVK